MGGAEQLPASPSLIGFGDSEILRLCRGRWNALSSDGFWLVGTGHAAPAETAFFRQFPGHAKEDLLISIRERMVGARGFRTSDPLLPKQVRYQAALRSARPNSLNLGLYHPGARDKGRQGTGVIATPTRSRKRQAGSWRRGKTADAFVQQNVGRETRMQRSTVPSARIAARHCPCVID